MERARDLFEQAVEKVPKEYAKTFYLMYGEMEEKYGLARHAMRVYDRATRAVDEKEKYLVRTLRSEFDIASIDFDSTCFQF